MDSGQYTGTPPVSPAAPRPARPYVAADGGGSGTGPHAEPGAAHAVFEPTAPAEPSPRMPGMMGPPPGGFAPYGYGPENGPSGKRNHTGLYVLAAVCLLVALAVGVGVGASLFHNTPGAPTPTVAIGAQSAPTVAVAPSAQDLQQNIENVIQAVQPSVVEITSVSGNQEAIGSGDIIDPHGYIVTNDHVVQGFDSFTVTLSNGTNHPAQIVGQDPQDDLAVLKISASNLQPIAMGKLAKVKVGEFAIAACSSRRPSAS
jgi:putative serine protease PepD